MSLMLTTPLLRPHVKADDAVQVLRAAANDASNVRGLSAGRGAHDLRDDYLRTSEALQRKLGNILDDLDPSLIQTETYWWIRAADSAAPRLIPLILSEAEALEARLTRLGNTIEQEHRRWADTSCILAVPDTNLFLNPTRPFDQIDWAIELDSSDVGIRLVAPLIVIHELDRLKRQGNNTAAKAARHAIRWLIDVLPHDPVGRSAPLASPGKRDITIEVYVHDGPTRPPDPDAMIIDFARQLGPLSGLPTCLATRDLGMRLRAERHGVDVRLLDDPPP